MTSRGNEKCCKFCIQILLLFFPPFHIKWKPLTPRPLTSQELAKITATSVLGGIDSTIVIRRTYRYSIGPSPMPYEACLTPLTYFNFFFAPLFVSFHFHRHRRRCRRHRRPCAFIFFVQRFSFRLNRAYECWTAEAKRKKNKVERKWPIESSGLISLCCVLFIVQLYFFLSRIDCQHLRRLKLTQDENCKAHHGDCVHCTAWKLCEQLAFWTLLERNNCLMLCFFYEYYHLRRRHRPSYDSWIVWVCK